ncbi:MAG: hypothetical protein ABEI06_09070 [Halobacteriaceae archaeon]
MSVIGQQTDEALDVSAVADIITSASFVHILAIADGDGIAASGILGRTLDTINIPYQISCVQTNEAAVNRIQAGDDTTTYVTVGMQTKKQDTQIAGDMPLSIGAYDIAQAIGADIDPLLAIVGSSCCAAMDDDQVRHLQSEADISQQPGVAIPTDEIGQGLMYSTRFHAPFSGSEDAVKDLLESCNIDDSPDMEAYRQLASRVALEMTTLDAPLSAANTIAEWLKPHYIDDGPFLTVEGYADVLSVLARNDPGLAVGLALDYPVKDRALSVWRENAQRIHTIVANADIRRYQGFSVAKVQAYPWIATRLLRKFRSKEPVMLGYTSQSLVISCPAATNALSLINTISESMDDTEIGGSKRLAFLRSSTIDIDTSISKLEAKL